MEQKTLSNSTISKSLRLFIKCQSDLDPYVGGVRGKYNSTGYNLTE